MAGIDPLSLAFGLLGGKGSSQTANNTSSTNLTLSINNGSPGSTSSPSGSSTSSGSASAPDSGGGAAYPLQALGTTPLALTNPAVATATGLGTTAGLGIQPPSTGAMELALGAAAVIAAFVFLGGKKKRG